jgi:hypothetical protein
MVSKERETHTLRERVERLFHELRAALPENCASIQSSSDPRRALIELLPSGPNAAPLTVIVPSNEREGVTLVAGKGSFFEIPRGGRRYTELPLIEELRSICLAVIAGRLEEWVVLDGTEVLRGKGIIELPEPMTVKWRRLSFRPMRKTIKMHNRYEPWVAGCAEAS